MCKVYKKLLKTLGICGLKFLKLNFVISRNIFLFLSEPVSERENWADLVIYPWRRKIESHRLNIKNKYKSVRHVIEFFEQIWIHRGGHG